MTFGARPGDVPDRDLDPPPYPRVGTGELDSGNPYRIVFHDHGALALEPFGDLTPLEGPEDDPWVQGWRAGLLDTRATTAAALLNATRRDRLERLALIRDTTIAVAIVIVLIIGVLALIHNPTGAP